MNLDDLTRMEILLADRATGDLDQEGYREIAQLQAEGQVIDDQLDLAAAALDLALASTDETPLPAALSEKLMAMAPLVSTIPQPPIRQVSGGEVVRPSVLGTRWVGWTGWLVAAACLLVVLWIWRQNQPQPPVDVRTQRAHLLGTAEDSLTLVWTATEDPAATGAGGDVVWSNGEQTGFMRIRGLRTNDASQVQYQLWIFDATRDNPVDGGVFNMPPNQSEVIVRINAKLQVKTPQLFAITVEKPGGVVVSKRERIVLVADPTKAG